jgi:hypothetical protein
MANAQAEESLAPRPLASRYPRRGQIALPVFVDPHRQLRLVEHQFINGNFLADERQNVDRHIYVRRVKERRSSSRFKPVQRQLIQFCAKLPDMKMEAAEFHARPSVLFDLAHHNLAHPSLHDSRFDQQENGYAHCRHRKRRERQPMPPAHAHDCPP